MAERWFASSGGDPASSGRKRVIAISALGQIPTFRVLMTLRIKAGMPRNRTGIAAD
jgi:hypothetical protein